MIHYQHFIITNDCGDQDYVEKINHFPFFHLENETGLWHLDEHQTWVKDFDVSGF